MKFTKMQGAGNDYIYFNLLDENIPNPQALAITLSDRHFGIGADGIVLIGRSDIADFSMRMFNADGSESHMCGNAARCVGKYVHDNGLTPKTELTIETKSGLKHLRLFKDETSRCVTTVRVNMGPATLKAARIPVTYNQLPGVINRPVIVAGKEYHITCLSMGNPHAVVFTNEVDRLDIETIGPEFEHHPIFPERTNAEFVQIIDLQTLKIRVWERGSGETLACGTGACASVVAAVINGMCRTRATAKMRGGDLEVEWNRRKNNVYLTGDAKFVFRGEI